MDEVALKPALEKVFDAKVYSWRANKNQDWLFLANNSDSGKPIPMSQHRSRLHAALHYEELGFSVLPVKIEIISADEIKKKPLVKWKPYQTTRATPGQIREWWLKWPATPIGVICGRISGIIAIDTDTPEADEEFQSLLPEGLEIPTCSTPRGGKHYIFRYDSEIKNLTRHFEVKSDGAIIILPPSKLPDGREYQWLSCPL